MEASWWRSWCAGTAFEELFAEARFLPKSISVEVWRRCASCIQKRVERSSQARSRWIGSLAYTFFWQTFCRPSSIDCLAVFPLFLNMRKVFTRIKEIIANSAGQRTQWKFLDQDVCLRCFKALHGLGRWTFFENIECSSPMITVDYQVRTTKQCQ